MTILAIFNQKGGSGKSMLAVHLAVAANRAGRKVCILDLDPQGSATAWRKARGETAEPTVVKVPAGALDRAIAGALADGFDFVLLDCPPAVSPTTAKIIGSSDLVVIPVRPEPFDLAAIPETLALIQAKKFVFVLSDCPPRAPEIEETRLLLAKSGRPVLGPVNNWRAMWRALVAGQAVHEYEPEGKAAQEIKSVCDAILKEIKVTA